VIGKSPWTIGELARATGVTVRTLHHYDDIGLLPASERTATGHRRYTRDDLRRLYRVRALRAIGMPLEEIRDVLDSSPEGLAGMRDLLVTQLDQLTARARGIDRLIEQVRGLLHRLETGVMPDPDHFMTTLEMISMLDSYFTPEQQAELVRRREALGQEADQEARTSWAGVVEELLVHVRDETPVDDPRVRDLAQRWETIGAAYHPEGPMGEQTVAATRRIWRNHSAEISRNLPWPVEQLTALTAYLDRVRAARSGD
jgi:MerR family transcriptional regulator, thiopeptide resistance regulator